MVAAPVDQRLVAQIFISLDGVPVEDALIDDLRYCHVESTVHLPDLATIQFNNPEFAWMEPPKFKVGQVLEVELGDSDLKRSVFKGEVTSLEVELGIDGDFGLIVRGYDKAHRLHRGRYTRSFLQVTDSDIAKQIAGELSFDSEVESTRIVHDYVLQNNQTNWEFLQQRAALLGFELQVSDNKLIFKPPPSTPAEPITLALRRQLLSFRARVTTGEQVNAVEVRGWDPVKKQEVAGRATRPEHLPEIGISKTGGELAQEAFHSEAEVVVARQPIYSQEEAQQFAQTVLEDLSSAYVTAEGVAIGDPKLRLGSKVKLESVGEQFSGEYLVTQVRHRYEQDGYRIDFEVTGRRSTDLVSLLQSPARPEMHILHGLVTNTKDPDDLGRVKVKFPTLPDEPESFWCRVVSPYAGNDRGFQFTPELDDEVLVMATDINQPYILGGLWNSQDRPPLPSSEVGGSTSKHMLKSRSGHLILMDDSAGGGGIQVVDAHGNKIVIDTSSDGLEIKADGDIKIKAGRSLEISAGQSIKIDAGTDLTLGSGTGAALDAGTQLDLKGNAGVAVQSSARVAVSAPNVSLG